MTPVLITALIVACLVVAAVLWPSGKKIYDPPRSIEQLRPVTTVQSIIDGPAPRQTLREQQVAEESAAIAAEYAAREHEVWTQQLRQKARELLAD